MSMRRAASLSLLCWLTACAAPIAERPAEALCADEPNEADTPHDRRMRTRLLSGLEDLCQNGGTATVATLRSQLDRRTAPLVLAEPETTELTGPELHARVLPAVGIVGRRYMCDKCTRWHLSAASGFFVTGDGAFVTSRHVIDRDGEEEMAVMTADGKVHRVSAVHAASGDDDVVILDVEGEGFAHLPLRADVATGESVFVLSHPAGHYWYLTSGLVGRRFVERQRGENPVESLDITADFARGSSGAPVLDATGAVVGVVRSTNSIYYEERDGEQRNLQMVFKRCVPAGAVMALDGE